MRQTRKRDVEEQESKRERKTEKEEGDCEPLTTTVPEHRD